MANPVLSPSSVSRKAKALLLSAFALTAIVLSIYPSGASASGNEYSGHNLPGHTWTTGNGVVLTGENFIAGYANTSSSVCVGPITYDGTFHAPYGWRCMPENPSWSFSPITAAAGLYNPNAGTFQNFAAIAYG
jgi:hypothetical protein